MAHPRVALDPNRDRLAAPPDSRGAGGKGRGAKLVRHNVLWGVAGLVLGVLGSVLLVNLISSGGETARSLSAEAFSKELGLRVERQNDLLRVYWDAALQHLDGLSNARLQIDDGGQRRILQVSKSQVKNGSLTYAPKSDDVTFHLEAFHQDGRRIGTDNLRFVWARSASGPSTVQEPVQSPIVKSAPQPRISQVRLKRGHAVVRGVLVRDTPVEVRVRVDEDGRVRHSDGSSPLISIGRKLKGVGSRTAGLLGF